MQHTFLCDDTVLSEIVRTISQPRLSRYMPAANNDLRYALRLYVWNARICESFYLPCQIAEVAIRNAISNALTVHFKSDEWYNKGSFKCQLPKRSVDELECVINRKRSDHGLQLTNNHVISGIHFGFWAQLLTKNFEKTGVWPNKISMAFPNAQKTITRQILYDKVERIRWFRNRVAHHYAVFDKGSMSVYADIIEVIGWCSGSTRLFVEHFSKVSQTINARPTA